MTKNFFVYIVTNRPWGTLYTGMTSDLEARVFQHKNGLLEGFTKRYSLKSLVYFEECGDAATAIWRETRIKKWRRTWKVNLIRTDNPDWKDLAHDWYPAMPTREEIEKWMARMRGP
jgi:putative endonuclease